MSNRMHQLDSIRGLASFSVMLHHISLAASIPIITLLTTDYSPFRVLTNGHAAVILFFILSGFVLFLPFLKGKQSSYKSYLTKRFFRIYIPYLVAIITSVILYYTIEHNAIDQMSRWFHHTWKVPLDAEIIMGHLFMIGYFKSRILDNVIWSLIHEMRISIIFPFLALILLKMNWKLVLVLCVLLSSIFGLNNHYDFEPAVQSNTGFSATAHYISMFLIGGLLAKYKDSLVDFYKKMTKGFKWGTAIVAFLCYAYYSQIDYREFEMISDILGDYVIAIGCSILVIFSLASSKASKVLELKPILFLGKISYSLYLYHLLVLTSLVYLLYGKMSLWEIYLLTIILSLLVSTISYMFIELPAMKWGKNLTEKSKKPHINISTRNYGRVRKNWNVEAKKNSLN